MPSLTPSMEEHNLRNSLHNKKNCWSHAGLSTLFNDEDQLPLSQWVAAHNIPQELASYAEFNEECVATSLEQSD